MKSRSDSMCPCGSGKPYSRCCQPLHQGRLAADAEALMRSRYSAYVLEREAYLLETWHAGTRPETLDLSREVPRTRWIGLEVRRHASTGDDWATVEFIARYRIGGRAHRLHEISRFVRENGRWYYLDGQFPDHQPGEA